MMTELIAGCPPEMPLQVSHSPGWPLVAGVNGIEADQLSQPGPQWLAVLGVA